MGAFRHKEPLFEQFTLVSGGRLPNYPGDVTWDVLIMNGFMHQFLHSHSGGLGKVFSEIPVENPNFSTISTGFSTRLFHK